MCLPYVDKLDPWSSHMIIYRWLQVFPPLTRILDVGTASGTIGKLCKANQFQIVGLEPNKIYANEAEPYYTTLINCSLDEASVEILSPFQVIILADVLEHMPEPHKSLSRLVSLQNKDSVFMISVPNIANIWVRINLLMGRFDYQSRGILDKTHLRFFTKSSFKKMVLESTLNINRLVVTPIPLNLVHPFFNETKGGRSLHRVLARFTQILPTLLGYQFVALAIKGQSD
jgi:2-polyprenyl-3-methyl-5-hydroxy-6-metoxy-1,4-benzoquinol methylase